MKDAGRRDWPGGFRGRGDRDGRATAAGRRRGAAGSGGGRRRQLGCVRPRRRLGRGRRAADGARGGGGTVTAVGSAVSDWTRGDAVMTHPLPLRDQGTWAPMLIAPAALLARKPHGVSWAAAAAFPIPALTAEQVLSDTLRVRAGEHLLVHGAGGVTGGLLVPLAALRGAQVIATAGPSSRQRVSALGARHVID